MDRQNRIIIIPNILSFFRLCLIPVLISLVIYMVKNTKMLKEGQGDTEE